MYHTNIRTCTDLNTQKEGRGEEGKRERGEKKCKKQSDHRSGTQDLRCELRCLSLMLTVVFSKVLTSHFLRTPAWRLLRIMGQAQQCRVYN